MSRHPMSKDDQGLIREHWIEATQFHRLDDREILERVTQAAENVARSGRAPIVLLDLDSTLYEVGPRTLAIIRDWMDTGESRAFPNVRSALDALRLDHVGYSLKETWKQLGLHADDPALEPAFLSLKRFWSQRFFSNLYLPQDRPYEGAAAFVRSLHERGADLIYLTGRDEPNMKEGTISNLLRDQFPWEVERTRLWLKATPAVPDVEHKVRAAEAIRGEGGLLASFENEPKNFVAIYQAFPKDHHVFVETICSDHPAEPLRGGNVYRLKTFGR